MKVKFLFFSFSVAALLLAACSGEKKQQTFPENGPQMTLSNSDTITVQSMVNDFLEQVKQGNIDDAVSRLFVLENDEVKPLSDEQRQEYRTSLGAFDFKGYRITTLTFFKETDSEVGYDLYLDDPAVAQHPRTIKGLIRPVRRNGAWYITLAHGHQHSDITHE